MTGLVFAFVVIKVYRVARLDTGTALALLSSSGVASVALGALLTVLPALLSYLSFYLFQFAVSDHGTRALRRSALEVVAAALILWSFLLPWTGLIVQLGVLTALFVFARVARRRGWDWMNFDWLTLVFVLIASTFITSRMWLPAEEVRTKSAGTITGYVLATDERWTTLLREDTRRVIILRSEDVESRRVCNLPDEVTMGRSLFQVIESEPGGPASPTCRAS